MLKSLCYTLLLALVALPAWGATSDAPAKRPQGSRRSPSLATTLAIVPGFAFHGTGHLYAGSYVKGAGLMLIEGASIWCFAAKATSMSSDLQGLFDNSKIPTDMSSYYSRIGLCTVALAGFLYTWFDDMSGAAIAAQKYNQRQEALETHASLQLMPAPGLDGVRVAISTRF